MATNTTNNNYVDILFSINPDINVYDISLDEEGQLTGTKGLDTALLMSLLCEQRASISQVAIPQYRRGWWGNTLSSYPNFQIGSLIWLYYQARKNDAATSGIITAIESAFAWLVEDGYLTNINVNAVETDYGVILSVELVNNNVVVNSISFNLWENTAVIK
jgi:phage gp46-like protein